MGRRNSSKKKQKNNSQGPAALKGTLDITRSGMGFVIVPDLETDILIRPNDFNTGLHGDTVRVRIKPGNGRRMQGEVVEVLERKRTEFIGRFDMNKGFGFFTADSDKPMPDIYIPQQNIHDAKDGDKVIVRLLQWENKDKRPVGEVVSIVDEDNRNDAAMKEILMENGFPIAFPEEALEIAARIPEVITSEEVKKRKDIRDILTFSSIIACASSYVYRWSE